MTPREKAEAVVVAGMPAGDGFGGVLVRQWNATPAPARVARLRRPGGRDGEDVPRARAVARRLRSTGARRRPSRPAARRPRRCAAPASTPPSRPSSTSPTGRSARGSSRSRSTASRSRAASGGAACAKHFPGLGSTANSTDVARVYGVLRSQDLAPFRSAIRAGVPCVMVGHAIYPRLGPRRASFEPKTYELLRRLGFRGVAITDSRRRPRQPLRAVLGAARAAGGRRPGADDERA